MILLFHNSPDSPAGVGSIGNDSILHSNQDTLIDMGSTSDYSISSQFARPAHECEMHLWWFDSSHSTRSTKGCRTQVGLFETFTMPHVRQGMYDASGMITFLHSNQLSPMVVRCTWDYSVAYLSMNPCALLQDWKQSPLSRTTKDVVEKAPRNWHTYRLSHPWQSWMGR